MNLYYANALIHDENSYFHIFRQSTYDSCMSVEEAENVIDMWKNEIYKGKVICTWIEKKDPEGKKENICFNNYINIFGDIDNQLS